MTCIRIVHELGTGVVKTIAVDHHSYSYAGRIPNTGPLRCVHCGHLEGTEGKMALLIDPKAPDLARAYGFCDREFYETLSRIAGTIVAVETGHLFRDQFNVEVPCGNCEGMRIMGLYVKEIYNDARIGKGRCDFCGKVINHPENFEYCPYCGKSGYIYLFVNDDRFGGIVR